MQSFAFTSCVSVTRLNNKGNKTGKEDILRSCWGFTVGDAVQTQRSVEEV